MSHLKQTPRSFRLRAYSEALYHALIDDPFYKSVEALCVPASAQRDAMLTFYEHAILEAERYGHLCEPEDEPVGVSIWISPLSADQQSRKVAEQQAFLSDKIGNAAATAYASMCDFMTVVGEPLVSENDWYLSILGIAPDQQGKGLGASLVAPVLTKTDALGVATYLETFTPRNMPFYARLGYETAGSFTEPVTGHEYWLMRRPPQTA